MTNTYNEESIQVLEGLDAVRVRPGMYIGGTDSSAVTQLLWEALDNAVDEHLEGYGSKIAITLHPDGAVQVQDDGRGIPAGVSKKTGRSTLEMVFQLHGGGKFNLDPGKTAYNASGGLNGVGIAAVAAVSTRATATVHRDGKEYVIQFRKGKQGVFKGDGETAEFTEKTGISTKKDPRSASEKKERPTGTSITWYPDYTIFDDEDNEGGKATLDFNNVLRRVENTCYLLPELTIVVQDNRDPEAPETYEFFHPNGIIDMLGDMSNAEAVNDPIMIKDEADITSRNVEKHMKVEIAAQWEQSLKTNTASFVNIVTTSLGGSHVTGALKGMEEAILEAIQSKGLLKAKDPIPEQQDISEGLNLVVSLSLPDPVLVPQTKEKLNETPVITATRRLVKKGFEDWLGARKNATQANAIFEKIIATARARKARASKFDVSDVMAEEDKEAVFSQKPENLKECQSVGDPRSELLIVEGSSALGSLYAARSAKFQAIFPLRGKPLNTYGMKLDRLFIPPVIKNPKTPPEKRRDAQRKKFLDAGHTLLQNKELDDLVKAIGAGFGETFDVEKMRYHNIIVVADADVDGAHIESLLIGFFYSYMPALIEQGRLYLACPPLFVVKAGKPSAPETLLASNDQELQQVIDNCREQGKKIIHVARRKGHGESSDEEVFDYITNPKTRRVKRITIEDARATQAILDLTLGDDAAPRKEWINDPATRALVNLDEVS